MSDRQFELLELPETANIVRSIWATTTPSPNASNSKTRRGDSFLFGTSPPTCRVIVALQKRNASILCLLALVPASLSCGDEPIKESAFGKSLVPGKFILFGVDNDVLKASLLATGEAIEHETTVDASSGHNIVTLKVPKNAPDQYVSVIKLVVSGAVSMDQTFMQLSDGKVCMGAYNANILATSVSCNSAYPPPRLWIPGAARDGIYVKSLMVTDIIHRMPNDRDYRALSIWCSSWSSTGNVPSR